MTQPLFLKPAFQEKPWGGTSLRGQFHYDIPSNQTGECWAVSGHPDGPSIVRNGPFAGKIITELWDEQPELFGNLQNREFPLLIKLIDAETDLPAQVYENTPGGTACFYMIDCKKGAEIILGHAAQTGKELESMIESGTVSWLRRVPVQPGDFFHIPGGSIHALGDGTLALEIKRSNALAYSVFDSDHSKSVLNAVSVPHQDAPSKEKAQHVNGSFIETLLDEAPFSIYKYDVSAETQFEQTKPFLSFSVIDGAGALIVEDTTHPLQKGDHFILPSGTGKFILNGRMVLIAAHP